MTERRTYVTLVDAPKCILSEFADDLVKEITHRLKKFDYDVSETIDLLNAIHLAISEDINDGNTCVNMWISEYELRLLSKLLFKYTNVMLDSGEYEKCKDQLYNLENIRKGVQMLDEEIEVEDDDE